MMAEVSAAEQIPVPNPVHDGFNISVLVPEEITVRMVDASALADYEIWFFISSVLSSAFIGFLVPYLQARDANQTIQQPLFWMTIVVFVLFLISFFMALGKRSLLKRKGRTMKLKTLAVTNPA